MGNALDSLPSQIPPSSCCHGGKTEEHSASASVVRICYPVAKPSLTPEEVSRLHRNDAEKSQPPSQTDKPNVESRANSLNAMGDQTAEEAAWLRVSFIEFVARASSAAGYKLDGVLPGGQSCQIVMRLSEDLSTLQLHGHSEFAAMIMSRGELVTDAGARGHSESLSVTIAVENIQSARSLASAADNPQFLGTDDDNALADAILRLGRNRVVEVRYKVAGSSRGFSGVLHLVDRDESEAELLAMMLTLLRLHGRHEKGLPGSERSIYSSK